MMPFICVSLGGTTLSNLPDSVKPCQGAAPPKTPLISYFICGQPNRSLSTLHLLPPTRSHLYPAQRWVHAVHPALQSDYLDQAISRGRLRHWVVKGSSVSQISQDLDTSNWDFMAYFLRDFEKLCPILPRAEFPRGSGWKKMFSGFIWFLVALRAFLFFFHHVRAAFQ